jgi:4,5-DOPA dioxygenase extradiol
MVIVEHSTKKVYAASMQMPSLYIGHGAPPLLDHEQWRSELSAWSANLPTPKAILIISAHWESAPLMVGATTPVPLIYDFYGFPQKYYHLQYAAPGAPELAARIAAVMPDTEPLHQAPSRGLDHGAYVPLMLMYPEANIPVLQMSVPTEDPLKLFELGRRLKPLQDEGVLIIGSGFMTHGLPFTDMSRGANQAAPGWSADFDAWANEALQRGDIETLMNYRNAPAFKYAHPTADHLVPMYVTLGLASDAESGIDSTIDGFWYGLSKRSFQVS